MRGACRARMPISPICPGTITISACPSYAAPSGVTSERSNFLPVPAMYLRRGERLAALDGALDRPDHVEGLLGQVVVLALDDLLEAADRVLEPDVLTRRP